MEQQQIIQSVANLFTGVDERNWNKVENTMAKSVLLDYTSLAGGSPETLSPKQIIKAWTDLIPGFDETHHQLSNFNVTVNGSISEVHYNGKADHYLNGDMWTVEGTYNTELKNKNGNWQITKHKFNLEKQTGNTSLPAKAMEVVKNKCIRKVQFTSEGLILKGNLYIPNNFDENKKYPTVIVTGSWTSIKEQMAGLYAQKLSEQGFVALAFDFSYWGESEGQPRQYESPDAKTKDIKNAVSYLLNQSFVNPNEITGLGICASAGYMAYAAAEDDRIKKFVTVAAWLHDKNVAQAIYNNWPDKYDGLIAKANTAKQKFATTGETDFVLACSDTDLNAAMYVPNGIFPYYIDEKLGAIPQYTNKFAVMSWAEWLQFDGVAAGSKIKQPTLMVHSDKAALPEGAKTFFASLQGNKKMEWLNDFNQMEFYYKEEAVNAAITDVVKWLNADL